MSPSAGIKSGSARLCGDWEEDIRVVHRNAAMTVCYQKYKRFCTEPIGMSSETSDHTSYRM